MKSFADRLREARKAADLTQEQLGFAVDVTKSSVSAWENGREMPSFKLLPQFRSVLGCSLDYLVCGSEYGFDGQDSESASNSSNELIARDNQEAMLLTEFRAMSSKQKKALIELMRK